MINLEEKDIIGGNYFLNPFEQPQLWRQKIIDQVKLNPQIVFNGKSFICVLITSRCHIGCSHCMFSSNVNEPKNCKNTMTSERITRLMKLVRDSNTEYLLVSGGGENFLEPNLIYKIVEETTSMITWIVTSAYWAKNIKESQVIIDNLFQSFIKGRFYNSNKKIYLRVSLDSEHIEKISSSKENSMQYLVNIINIFEKKYSKEKNFLLQFHSLEDEKKIAEALCNEISGEISINHISSHNKIKKTESAWKIKLKSGYEFEITFAKRLLSDLETDLNDEDSLKKKIETIDKDTNENENGNPSIKYDEYGNLGHNILVVYNGRVSGCWQAEMPDVSINLDNDNFNDIMKKTMSDPAVLGTIEKGFKYRNKIINEVCPKAVKRSKAINIRDYTSIVLFEEDKVKLYYSLRVIQDYIKESRLEEREIPDDILQFVRKTENELQNLYFNANYDIIQQFIENDMNFNIFFKIIEQYFNDNNYNLILDFLNSHPDIEKRTIDKWRQLFKRIANDWYDLTSHNKEKIQTMKQIGEILLKILNNNTYFDGLIID